MIDVNNPGNIRYNPKNQWRGLANPPEKNGYCAFTDPLWGLRAMCIIIAGYKEKYGVINIDMLIDKWAPPGDDNPTDEYAAYVAQKAGFDPTQNIDLHDADTLSRIIPGMCMFENGPANVNYTPALYLEAARAALSP
jgi:hypothetical protein